MPWLNPQKLMQLINTEFQVAHATVKGQSWAKGAAYRPGGVYGYGGGVAINLGDHNIWAGSSLVIELPGYFCFKGSRFIVEWEFIK